MAFRVKHGMSGTPEFVAWTSMRQRCGNPRCRRYANYGGRGISICERWRAFENFLADMGRRPSPDHSLDRIDNDGNYELGNCRWATRSQQQRNKSNYTDKEKLPRGDDHWTRKDTDRARSIARLNIVSAHKSGAANGNARLTEPSVRDIKHRIAMGESDVSISASYSVRPGTIWFIRTGKHWSHVQ
jgi:hypothetical protein